MTEGLFAVAVAAGMVAAVNPCGFALLPAYASVIAVGSEGSSRAAGIVRALRLALAMTVGFAGLFAVFGLLAAPVASTVAAYLPWVTLAVGVMLTGVGAWVLAGRSVTVPLLLGRRRHRQVNATFPSLVGFGATYAAASLTCTVAPFLAVVASAFSADSVLTGVGLFLAYAAGMGLVVATVAVAVVLGRDSLLGTVRRGGRWVSRVSGLVLLLAGAYVAYYAAWEIRVLSGASPADPVVDAALSVQRSLATAVDAIGPIGWAVALALLLAAGAVLVRRRET